MNNAGAGHAPGQLDAYGRYSDAHNLEAEAALLGALMINNDLIDTAAEYLGPDDFYLGMHSKIAHAMWRQHGRGQTVTPVTLKPIVERDPYLAELGGIRYLAELTADGQALINPIGFITQVADMARIRRVQFAAQDMVHDYLSGDVTFEESLVQLDSAMGEATAGGKQSQPQSAAQMIQRVIDRSDRITETGLGQNVGMRCTTVSDVNAMLEPLELATYIVIGGRPSMGKSTLASCLARGYAGNGHPTLYAFAEGTEDKLAMRFAADLSLDTEMPLTTEQIQKDKLTKDERAHYHNLLRRAESLPIDYINTGRCDIQRLRRHAMRMDAKWREQGRRLELLVVDYMQLLGASAGGREIVNDREKVNAVSAGLLQIVQDIGCTVVALSQLSRSLEQREDKRPRLSDLRESGRIEEDADVVMFVYREEYYLERNKPERSRKDFDAAYLEWQSDLADARNRVEIILAKNRDGAVKSRRAKFYGNYTAIRGGDFELPDAADKGFDFEGLKA